MGIAFVRWWDVHRDRIAPAVAAKIDRSIAEGRMTDSAARVTGVQAVGPDTIDWDTDHPAGMEEAGKLLRNLTFVDGPYEALAGADAAVIVTEWDQFRALDLDRVKLMMARPTTVDLRNVYRADEMRVRRFAYTTIGRG